LQAIILGVRDHPDNFKVGVTRSIRRPFLERGELNPLTDGIFVREVTAGERLIDDGYMSS